MSTLISINSPWIWGQSDASQLKLLYFSSLMFDVITPQEIKASQPGWMGLRVPWSHGRCPCPGHGAALGGLRRSCPPEKQLQFFSLLLWLLQDTTHSHPTQILFPLQQERQEFLHFNNLFDFCSRSAPCLCSLSVHIFKAAFYFPSGDQEFFVGELHSQIMRGCNHTPQRALNYLPSVLEAVQITQEC